MSEIIDWLSGLDPVFTFLLALPFVVAIAGLLARVLAPFAPAFAHRQRRRTAMIIGSPRVSRVAVIFAVPQAAAPSDEPSASVRQ